MSITFCDTVQGPEAWPEEFGCFHIFVLTFITLYCVNKKGNFGCWSKKSLTYLRCQLLVAELLNRHDRRFKYPLRMKAKVGAMNLSCFWHLLVSGVVHEPTGCPHAPTVSIYICMVNIMVSFVFNDGSCGNWIFIARVGGGLRLSGNSSIKS